MALDSQTPQASMRRQYMTRRHKSPRWPWIAIVVLVVATLGWMLLTDSDDTTQQADAAPGKPASAAAAAPPVATRQAPPPIEAPPSARPANPMLRTPPAPANPTVTTTEPVQTPQPQQIVPPAPPAPVVAQPPSDQPTQYAEGMALLADGKVVEARAMLSRLLFDADLRLRPADAATARDAIASINKHLIFGKTINEDDPFVDRYTIQSGDYLVRIAPKYGITPEFIQMVNGVDPGRLMVGQKLKVIRGPFHVRISKRDYRLDVYLKDDMGQPVYVTSLPVGLGEGNSTPVGNWIIKTDSKIKNPGWTNPRTHESYGRDDPNNPIGEYWLGLLGTDPTTESISGYGIHGTIDPDSIGSQQSMGCVRLRDADIEFLFNLLVPGQSTVQILP